MAMVSILGLYNYDESIFDDLTVPSGMDKAELIETILFQNAELELLYSDPATMKLAIKGWSASSQYTWNALQESLEFDYNPIWNKDGTITETESVTGESSGSNELKVSAYNDSTYQPREKTDANNDSTSSRTYTRVEQGNIGVTSTMQLINEQRETVKFNIYDQVSADFRKRFCLVVY